MPLLACPACQRTTEQPVTGVCARCSAAFLAHLDTIIVTWTKAHDELMPSGAWSGGGAHVFGSKPPCNIAALSWEEGHPILNILSEWEKLVREERHLVPLGMLPPLRMSDEIARLVGFHRHHAEWTCRQAWADEMLLEMQQLAKSGLAASRQTDTRVRILCPGETHEGEVCGKRLTIPEDHNEYVHCTRCQTMWTVPWLMRVALENVEWLDAAHLEQWFKIPESNVRRWAQQGKVRSVRADGSTVFSKSDAIALRDRLAS